MYCTSLVDRAFMLATKERNSLLRSDGKHLDGLTLISWCERCSFDRDIAVADTTAASCLPLTSVNAGSAAESAASQSRQCSLTTLSAMSSSQQ